MGKLVDIVRRALRDGTPLDLPEGHSERGLIRVLAMLTHDGDTIVRQRACLELGEIISQMSQERIDNYLRRLLWRMNPEAGDHPVGTPELIGEIGRRSHERIAGFLPGVMLYLEDEKLLPGLLQAAGRIGQKNPDALSPYVEQIFEFLEDSNPVAAGNAALALCRIGGDPAERARQALSDDKREVSLFFNKKGFRRITLEELVERCSAFANDVCFIANLEED
jgi:hypothetical protein